MQRPDSGLVSDEFRNAAALIRHACRHGVARINAVGGHRSSIPWDRWHELRLLRQLPQDEVDEIAEIPSSTRTALAHEFEPTIAEYRRLWLARNRPGGLDDSTGRWEAMLAEYRRS